MKTILVSLDLSPVSPRVCEVAIELAKARKARLVLLNVVEAPLIHLRAYGPVAAQIYGMQEELERRAARELLGFGRRCRVRRVPVRTDQITGRAAPTIISVAKRLRAETIVIGSHGHGAAFDLLVGSVAQAVLRNAPCPVLVVPANTS